MYLYNAWYVAAWDHEIGQALTPVRMLDQPIVLYRTSAGKVAALEDACPHRKLPLSKGRLLGDQVECGYHGLTFDASGTCTRVPGAERIPHRACVRSYPVEERYGLVWVWMGEAALADPAKIFHVDHWEDPTWGINRGDAMTLKCNYLYMSDNLLDPSHVAWVHRSSFAGAGTDEVALNTDVGEKGVTVWRWMMDTPPAPFYAQFLKFQGNCDRKQHYEVHWPSHAIIRAIFSPAGTGGEGQPLHRDSFVMDSYNFMTPVSATETRYYWFQMRNFAPKDAEVSARFATSVRGAFEEDRVVLEAVQEGMDAMLTPNLDLAIDLGPMRFRARLRKMIEAETAARNAPAATLVT
ncbi:aromatic ring-hydroxylating dioxygenase subunit alpha [Xinfangfangia sp. CPCC 101601]|uniref:Aromatic ring-hydroxylating dioxygenase subunit alpha n=1 Tax=Pseudogemmobacter lacusdianii TaxID=3069608 RepID=A0ABU0VWQ4_9RHOB|nr:aromatic ring-hydroxylating dioxygenase subunit alpha [Xinfangfangia sp. CPCC 101601]MDQ2066053.1 aromatic ring-hydroxylating dioxygenase subunit alpha [Xinfangfangia sp. CPCC 101601]